MTEAVLADALGTIADISHHQVTVDFAAMIAGGMTAVILKASQGTTFTDPTFSTRAATAKAAGLLVGAYHYFDPISDPIAQARYFLGVAGAAGINVLAVDFEPSTAGADQADAAALCRSLHDVTGRWPLLYTGSWSAGPSNPVFAQCPLWLSQWRTSETPTLPPGFTDWRLWQFADAPGAVPGVPGACGRSRFNGTDLRAWWGDGAGPSERVIDEIDTPTSMIQIVERKRPKPTLRCAAAAVTLAAALAWPHLPSSEPPPRPDHAYWGTPTFRLEPVVKGCASCALVPVPLRNP